MSIFEHIQYLITRHDCIVVAGLGAFVAQRVPATFSSDGRMLLPPARNLVFNSALTHDDGLLAGSVARRCAITFEAAREEISRQVELIRARLRSEGYVEFPRIGRLNLTGEQLLEFIPDTVNPIADILYRHLPAVVISEANAEDITSEPYILEVDTIGRRIRRRLAKAGKYAAIIAMIVAGGTMLTTPVLLDRPADHASLSLPRVTPAKKATLPAALTVEMNPADNLGPEATPRPAVVSFSDYSGSAPEADFSCFVIVGSCSSEAEARRFISRNGGSGRLGIISRDGRYRIYAAMSNDYDAAYAFKTADPSITANFSGAWVLSI